jgi:thiol-disulfide isomerase/thioredoxin
MLPAPRAAVHADDSAVRETNARTRIGARDAEQIETNSAAPRPTGKPKPPEATMIGKPALAFLALASLAQAAHAGDLVREVRYKLSAGDLASGAAAVEDYRRTTGADAEYLNAVGWLARGAAMLGRDDDAKRYVAELRSAIPNETSALVVPLGAAIEVQAKLLAAESGRGAALHFLRDELARAAAPALRSRIEKNINLLSLEGQPAPPLPTTGYIGAAPPDAATLAGTPLLLFFFNASCGDCRAQAPSLARIWQKYRSQGLTLIAVTRHYGTVDDKPLTLAEENGEIERVWRDVYAALDGVPALIDDETMIRYGGSATPTFALLDRKGIVRLYAPTRLSEAELSRRIDAVLSERP